MPIRRPDHGCHGYSSSRNSVLWAFSSRVVQRDQAPRLTWIQTTCAGGVRARLRRVAGCATPSGSAGHAGETANLELTFHLDHSAGADQWNAYLELDIMRRPIAALVLTAGLAMATVAAPSQAQAQWRGWGWGLGGFAIGALAGAAIASTTWGYPGYYGYGYPAYGYGYAYPSYGYGYGNGPAYGVSYSYSYPA